MCCPLLSMGRVISWPKSFVCLTRNSTVTPPGSKTATARSSTCSARFLTWPTTTPPLGNLLTGPSPAYFSFIFGSFQANNNTIFTANSCEKYPSSIWRWDSNTQPLEHEYPPITTRPGPTGNFPCIIFSWFGLSNWAISSSGRKIAWYYLYLNLYSLFKYRLYL